MCQFKYGADVISRSCDMLVVPVTECNRPIKKEIQPQSDIRTHVVVMGSHYQYQTLLLGNKRRRRFSLANNRQARFSLADKRQACFSLADKMFEIT